MQMSAGQVAQLEGQIREQSPNHKDKHSIQSNQMNRNRNYLESNISKRSNLERESDYSRTIQDSWETYSPSISSSHY